MTACFVDGRRARRARICALRDDPNYDARRALKTSVYDEEDTGELTSPRHAWIGAVWSQIAQCVYPVRATACAARLVFVAANNIDLHAPCS